MITEEMKKQIAKMWLEGISGGKIAETLDITRNSVMGLVHRLKLVRSEKKIIKPIVKKKKIKPVEVDNFGIIKNEFNTNIVGLNNSKCKFIISEQTGIDAIYCGAPIHRESYCKEHYDICYRPIRSR